MSCSRETCFSAFSCRRAPTKSRLMIASSPLQRRERPVRKKDAGVTHVTGRPFSWTEYTPGRVDGHSKQLRPVIPCAGPARPTEGARVTHSSDAAAPVIERIDVDGVPVFWSDVP